MTNQNKVCWYIKGLNNHLSKKGYVQFVTKEAMSEDFKDGEPYTYNESEKTFGRCDMVTNRNEAENLSEVFKMDIATEQIL